MILILINNINTTCTIVLTHLLEQLCLFYVIRNQPLNLHISGESFILSKEYSSKFKVIVNQFFHAHIFFPTNPLMNNFNIIYEYKECKTSIHEKTSDVGRLWRFYSSRFSTRRHICKLVRKIGCHLQFSSKHLLNRQFFHL